MNKTENIKNKNSIQLYNTFLEFFPIASISNSSLSLTHHSHSHAEIFSCNDGCMLLNFPHNRITLTKGDVAIVPAGIKHSRTPSTEGDAVWNAMGIICTKRNLHSGEGEDIFAKISPFINGSDIWIFHNKPEFCSTIRIISQKRTEEIDALLSIRFFYELYKSIKDSKAGEVFTQNNQSLKDIDRFIIIDRILNFEYMQSFTNKQIADELYIGERQLSRLILTHYGAPFHKLIIKRRLEAAASYLAETDINIEEIAHSVGFSNKTIFYKEFKTEFGITPAQYRKKNGII